jgi:hypothetical protein
MMNKLIAGLLVALAAFHCEAKRAAPTAVPPVEADGVVYAAPSDPIGCVVASSGKSGKTLWFRQVYVVRYEADLETDIQDCFINGLKLEKGKLVITNEAGSHFELDLETLAVKVVQGLPVVNRAPGKR